MDTIISASLKDSGTYCKPGQTCRHLSRMFQGLQPSCRKSHTSGLRRLLPMTEMPPLGVCGREAQMQRLDCGLREEGTRKEMCPRPPVSASS